MGGLKLGKTHIFSCILQDFGTSQYVWIPKAITTVGEISGLQLAEMGTVP